MVLTALILATGRQDPTDLYVPARLIEGAPPESPGRMIVGGGEVLLEVGVEKNGRVGRIDRLRVTPPYTDLVITAVESWRFLPAEAAFPREPRHAVESRVLVAALYRPPATYLGTTLGEVPRDVARPSTLIPFPHELVAPPYPPNAKANAMGSITVVLEVEIAPDGSPRNIRVMHSGGALDSAAIQAAERWSFWPARLPDGPVTSLAYLVIGFREPVVSKGR